MSGDFPRHAQTAAQAATFKHHALFQIIIKTAQSKAHINHS